MTDAHQRARLAHIVLAGRRAYLELRRAEQREVVRLTSRIMGDPIECRQKIAAQTVMLRGLEIELRGVKTEESQALTNLRRFKYYKDHPHVPGAAVSIRPPPLPGPRDHIDLEYAEAARRWVWEERPYRDDRPADYIAETRSFPPDVNGCCRHKSAWLVKLLGGRLLFGRRTDQDVGPHVVARLRCNGEVWIADFDRLWAEADAPFRVEEFNLR